jgi:HD superfamily phosphohydrolase
VIDLLFGNAGESSAEWIASLIEGSAGADVLDYIDRDAFNCGLDHRIDSAIYRWFTLDRESGPASRGRHILPKLYGNHGFRVDADHAVLSILAERYALFLKVYTHPAKLAAGAMIGKALALAMEADPETFAEAQIERWTDSDLLDRIAIEGPAPAQRLMNLYRDRKLYRPAFRAHVLPRDGLTDDNYSARQVKMASFGLLEPGRRLCVERDIAKDASIADDDLIIYATRKAPGATSVRQRVLRGRGHVSVRDKIHKDHRDIFKRHLALWRIYIFCRPGLASEKQELVASLGARRWEMNNDITHDRRQMDLELG